MVGVRSEPRFAGAAVSAACAFSISRRWCRTETRRTGMPNSPRKSGADSSRRSAMLMGWLIPPWLPNGERPVPSIAIRVPLPGTTFINASNDVELVMPILEGDRLNVVEVVSVSPEKQTRVGVGHFVETCDSYYRADGSLVATNRNARCSVHSRGAVDVYRRLATDESPTTELPRSSTRSATSAW